jgi:hypothetical protein
MPDVRHLICHGDTPGAAVRSIRTHVERTAARLRVTYTLEGELEALRIPAKGHARIGERLWQHTCFEVFVRADGDGYHEINISPSRAWAVYAFARYREGEALFDEGLAPAVDVRCAPYELELDATIDLARLSPAYANTALLIGLSAVVEATDGSLSYWALAHAPGRPDFHHAHSFGLELT